jgi:hypothetical protein
MLPIQLLLILALAVALVITWRRVRDGVIRPLEAMGWSVIWIAAGLVIALPDTTSVVARLVGVGRGVDLILYASVALLFFLIFKIFIKLDRIERQITEVVRKDALSGIGPAVEQAKMRTSGPAACPERNLGNQQSSGFSEQQSSNQTIQQSAESRDV